MHLVTIIVAVILLGGIRGYLGVFFAIPLATLVKAVLSAWPSNNEFPEQKNANRLAFRLVMVHFFDNHP